MFFYEILAMKVVLKLKLQFVIYNLIWKRIQIRSSKKNTLTWESQVRSS